IYIFTPGGYSTWSQYDFQNLCASLRRCTALRTFAFVSELFIDGLEHLFYDFAFPNLRELKIVSDFSLNMHKWNNKALNHLTQLHLGTIVLPSALRLLYQCPPFVSSIRSLNFAAIN